MDPNGRSILQVRRKVLCNPCQRSCSYKTASLPRVGFANWHIGMTTAEEHGVQEYNLWTLQVQPTHRLPASVENDYRENALQLQY
mmetsp:Transcript_21925/g.36224  ORF Transcript_21925/g.36224 Transcript_21925/m.36224 type:complete len:85 (-) Transcript_21925:118-372(-)